MSRRAHAVAVASLLALCSAPAAADDAPCTCAPDAACPCPAPSPYPDPPAHYQWQQYPAPQYPPPQYAPPQYAPPQYAPPQYAPRPEPLMPYEPARAKYDYREVTRPRWGMFGGGAGLFALSWGIPAITGASIGYGKLAIPFAGPILLVTENWHADPCGNCTLIPLVPYVVIDVLAQVTGAIVAVAGLFTTEKVWLYSPKLTLAPSASPAFTGLVASGRF